MTDENALKQLKRMKAEKNLQADEYNAIAAGILALKEKIEADTRRHDGDLTRKVNAAMAEIKDLCNEPAQYVANWDAYIRCLEIIKKHLESEDTK